MRRIAKATGTSTACAQYSTAMTSTPPAKVTHDLTESNVFSRTLSSAADHITLTKNPYYFRAADGYPKFDSLTFRFITNPDTALSELVAGRCDILDPSIRLDNHAGLLQEMQTGEQVQAFFTPGLTIEWLGLGVFPAAYDDAVITVSALADSDGKAGGLGIGSPHRQLRARLQDAGDRAGGCGLREGNGSHEALDPNGSFWNSITKITNRRKYEQPFRSRFTKNRYS